jgi:hypothetical protein
MEEKKLSSNDEKNILKTFLASDLIGDLIGEIFQALQTYPT